MKPPLTPEQLAIANKELDDADAQWRVDNGLPPRSPTGFKPEPGVTPDPSQNRLVYSISTMPLTRQKLKAESQRTGLAIGRIIDRLCAALPPYLNDPNDVEH